MKEETWKRLARLYLGLNGMALAVITGYAIQRLCGWKGLGIAIAVSAWAVGSLVALVVNHTGSPGDDAW